MIKKVKGGYALFHCHGVRAGKKIKGSFHKTRKAALAQHRAIQANKRRRGK